jgi:hypothetical protein
MDASLSKLAQKQNRFAALPAASPPRRSVVRILVSEAAMKAVEFASTMTQEGQISLPPEVAREVPAGEQLRVVIMREPSGSDDAWRSAGWRRFEAAYGPGDDVYEQLIG